MISKRYVIKLYDQALVAFDFVIANKDRHFGNYGLLRDNDSGEVLGMALLLDIWRYSATTMTQVFPLKTY